jgi:hypothetical protein
MRANGNECSTFWFHEFPNKTRVFPQLGELNRSEKQVTLAASGFNLNDLVQSTNFSWVLICCLG